MAERKPKNPIPRGTIPQYSVPHRVKDTETWQSLADRYGIPPDEIIFANFQTLVPEEINWYLRYYVGCKVTADGRNRRFTSDATPGIIHIPPKKYTFPPDTILGTLPPKFYTVSVHPDNWQPPPGLADNGASAKKTVTIDPWRHSGFTIGDVTVKGRGQWGGSDPKWENELIYYNTLRSSLADTLERIVVHHTDNDDGIAEVEKTQKGKGYAALGYHFFVAQSGDVYEGRPLEVMGSHAGEGTTSGPLNDPDWGSIGIVVQGDYHNADNWIFSSSVPAKQISSLEKLIVALRGQYGVDQLLMHREIVRKGKATVCPGDAMVPHVESLRKKLAMKGL